VTAATIVLFHSDYGLRPAVHAAADRLRAAGRFGIARPAGTAPRTTPRLRTRARARTHGPVYA